MRCPKTWSCSLMVVSGFPLRRHGLPRTRFRIGTGRSARGCPQISARVAAKHCRTYICSERFAWDRYVTNSDASCLLLVSSRFNLLMRRELCTRWSLVCGRTAALCWLRTPYDHVAICPRELTTARQAIQRHLGGTHEWSYQPVRVKPTYQLIARGIVVLWCGRTKDEHAPA